MDVIELAMKYGELRGLASKVIGDWHATEKMQGQVIHSTECKEECRRCKPEPKAPQWASLKALDELMSQL